MSTAQYDSIQARLKSFQQYVHPGPTQENHALLEHLRYTYMLLHSALIPETGVLEVPEPNY
jgi:hypothetical protein